MRVRAAALALMLATPVAAQDRMTLPLCQGALDAVVALADGATLDGAVQLDAEGWCQLNGARIAIEGGSEIFIGAIRWRGSDMGRFVNNGLPPRTFEIAVTGIRVLPQTGDPVYDYLLGLQAQSGPGLGMAANLRWDGLQNALIVEAASLRFDAANRIEVSGRIEGVDLTDTARIQTSLGTAGLRNLTLKAEFDGWFETYLALLLGSLLLEDSDVAPAAQVEALKVQAIAAIAELPDDVLPASTVDALSAFITSMPQPRGSAQLQISAEPPIGMARLAPLAALANDADVAQVVETAMEGISILFTWTPAKETP